MGMALKFNCNNCNADVYTKFLKIGEEYKCKSCSFFRIVPEDAQSINESEIPNPENFPDKEQNQKQGTEQVNGTTSTGSKYPALKTISGFYNFIAFLSVIIAVLAFIYGATLLDSSYTETQGIIMMISSIIYGLIAYLVSKAIAEGILLFIDIANDLSDLKTNLLKND